MPVVSPNAIRSAPSATTRSTMSATRFGSMSPSNGQPKLVAMITSALAPRAVQLVDQRGDVVERLGGGAVDVALVVRVTRRDDHLDLGEPGGQGALRAARVGHQGRIADGRDLRDLRPHLVGVGHLRYRLRVHERHRLDPADARGGKGVQQLDLGRGRAPAPRSGGRLAGRPRGSIQSAGNSAVHEARISRVRVAGSGDGGLRGPWTAAHPRAVRRSQIILPAQPVAVVMASRSDQPLKSGRFSPCSQ